MKNDDVVAIQPVMLEMVDAWSDVQKFTLEGLQRLRPLTQRVVGFLAYESDECYVLAGDSWKGEDGTMLFGHPHVVPKGMVKRCVVLDEGVFTVPLAPL